MQKFKPMEKTIMLIGKVKRILIFFTSLTFLFTTLVGGVNAAMVETDAALSSGQRSERVSDIQSWMAQDRVRDQLTAMGVDPADARQRVAGMTSDELRMLENRIENLPAGAGAVEVIGLVFIVLLVLELVGVTHIFSHF